MSQLQSWLLLFRDRPLRRLWTLPARSEIGQMISANVKMMLFQTFYWKCFSPGFYCLEGSKTATPMSSVSGGVCPAGHYCTEGSSVPSPCPAGSYQNETGGKGRDDCKPCPFGKQEAVLYDLSSVLSGDVLTD